MNFGKLIDKTGLLEPEDYDKEILPQPDNTGSFDVDKLQELIQFCDKNKKYHIITQIDTDEGFAYVNRIAFVNRISYWLGNKSKNKNFESYFKNNEEH